MTTMHQKDPALAGVRIVDLTTVIFGPYATQTLADYGADVIKIETPSGDSTRYNGPNRDHGMSSLYLGVNRNKRSVVLDLQLTEAREALLALIDTADVFVHNIRPQKLPRLGLTPEILCVRNPRLIFVGLHGFGEDGPYAGAPAYDDIIQALSGAADLVKRQTGTSGYFPTVVADKLSAQMAVHAVLAALYQRERTGRGQQIEIPMFECMVSFLMVEHFYARHMSASNMGAAQTHELGYPRSFDNARRPYRTADGSVCLMPYTDENWRRFFAAVGLPELATDDRFVNITQRTRHITELLQLLADLVVRRDTAYWQSLCSELDIPCARINRLEDLESDPHLLAVGFFQETETRDGAGYRFPSFPVKLSASTVVPRSPPALGEHTREVLSALNLDPGIRNILCQGTP